MSRLLLKVLPHLLVLLTGKVSSRVSSLQYVKGRAVSTATHAHGSGY